MTLMHSQQGACIVKILEIAVNYSYYFISS